MPLLPSFSDAVPAPPKVAVLVLPPGAIATPPLPQGDFGLSLFQDGLLPAAFMVGLLVSSPVFAEASKHYNAFRLIGTGLGVWTLAVRWAGRGRKEQAVHAAGSVASCLAGHGSPAGSLWV